VDEVNARREREREREKELNGNYRPELGSNIRAGCVSHLRSLRSLLRAEINSFQSILQSTSSTEYDVCPAVERHLALLKVIYYDADFGHCDDVHKTCDSTTGNKWPTASHVRSATIGVQMLFWSIRSTSESEPFNSETLFASSFAMNAK
jgi:hypothetical protein